MKHIKLNKIFAPIFLLFITTLTAQINKQEKGISDNSIQVEFNQNQINNAIDNKSSCTCMPTYKYISIEHEILILINQHRQGIGLNQLSLIDHISNIAETHVDYMISTNTINHDNFYNRQQNFNCVLNSVASGENVAVGYNSAVGVVAAWLESTSHRRAIEGNYTHFGISVKESSSGAKYFCNNFVRSASGSCATTTPIQSCFADVDLNSVISGSTVVYQEASNIITSTSRIYLGGHSEYNAGVKVILSPGFRVFQDGTFKAYTGGCTNGFAPNNSEGTLERISNSEMINPQETLNIYPNPTQNHIFIEDNYNIDQWSISSSSGIVLLQDKVIQDTKQLKINDLETLNPGIYFLKVSFKNGQIKSRTIIKN